MQQSTGIHCKVICNDQIRRFQFSGSEFSLLYDQVKKILGMNSEFVLKYKDNEGDMITISSTEELSCAIDISQKNDGGLIRLSVFPAEPTCTSPSFQVPPSCPVQTEYGRGDFCPRGRGGRGGRWGGGGGGRWGPREGGPGQSNEFPCKNRFERRRAKLTFKRDLWKAYLTSLEQAEGELSPEEERRKHMFEAKVQRLESILSEFGPPPSKTEGLGEKTDVQTDCPVPEKYEWVPRQKFHKKERKCKRKEYKKESKNTLSKEDKAEILVLKSQIKELKPVIWGLQEQIKAKKSQVDVLYETTQQTNPELKNEISRLLQEKRAKKAQMEPLKQRIRQLKGK